MNENFLEIISNIQKKKILCIGDIILDNYISNEFIKISEEDPVNVIKRRKESFKLGGVGNVALNLKNFGINLDLITLGSKDEKFKIIKELIKENNINSKIFYFKNSITTIKERQYVNNYHLLRTDNEKYFKIQNKQINIITNFIKKKIKSKKYDAILVSDYGKGLVSNLFFSNLSLIAKKNKIKIFVDPKSNDLNKYAGSYCIKPNNKEMNLFLEKFGLSTSDLLTKKKTKKIKQTLNKTKINNFIVTRSNQSTIYFKNDKRMIVNNSKINELNVVNSTGAGDTFFAVFTSFYLVTNNFKLSISVANLFSEFAVKKFGTYAPSLYDLIFFVLKIKKFDFIEDNVILKKLISEIKNTDIKIGFTNGCFDILHSGHIKLFKEARENCDLLIVGVNSDMSVKKNKGIERPYNNLSSRLDILEAINYIDLVCVFHEKTPIKLIKVIKPDILFKGSDYKHKKIVGTNIVKKNNGKIRLISIKKNFSSSKYIEKLKK